MSSLPARSNPNAMMQLGRDQIAVRVEGGFIVAARKTVRLYFGPHLYSATVGTPGPTVKVTPYQPGYMLLAASMGATLMVPPTVPDPATGRAVPNPQIELVPGSSVIRSVKATAICAARDDMGTWHISNQSITVDSESVLRQALLKIESDELVQVLSDAEVQADREAGKLRGWITVPFLPGYQLAGRAGAKAIREALQTYNNLSATIRQRACTKAERLACDHNPVMRMSWVYGDLKIDVEGPPEPRPRYNPATGEPYYGDPKGFVGRGTVRQSTTLDGCREGESQISLPYAEVDVVSWTESRGQAAIDAFVQALLASQEIDGVGSLTINAAEGLDDAPDDDEDEAPPRQITEKTQGPALVISRQPEPVVVQSPAPEPAFVAASAPVQTSAPVAAPAAAPTEDPRNAARRRSIAKLETQLPPADVAHCREAAGVVVGATADTIPATLLEAYVAELYAAKDAIQ